MLKQYLKYFNYDSYTPIQEEIIPLLLDKKNVFALAKTGSGKTLSYILPSIDRIIWEEKEPQILILACTRELVKQIKEECSIAGSQKRIKTVAVYGKENIENQKALLKQQCHIVVATPGRLIDLIKQNSINLSNIKMIIIDEADYMFDLGFYESVKEIYTYLPTSLQHAYFSATKKEELIVLMNEYATDMKLVEIKEEVNIKHFYKISDDLKTTLKQMLVTLDIESTIIFCKKKEEIKYLYDYLIKDIPCTILHGDLLQKQRFENLDKFSKKEIRVLIASDVAARGIDINKVSHIIHYDGFENETMYIHRCGRSARKNESGTSIVLVNELNEFMNDILNKHNALDLSEYKNNSSISLLDDLTVSEKSDFYKSQVEKIYINAGSEKKIAARDIIGTLLSIENINKDDIGVIEILRRMSYVEIYNHKASYIVSMMSEKTIKKKKVKVEIAK